MVIRDSCPDCASVCFKKNGHIHNGKQNHLCKTCGRQFVSEFEQRIVSGDDRERVRRLLAERISMHGICRVIDVGMKWLMGFAVECYDAAPENLHVKLPERRGAVLIRCLRAEADELLSFVTDRPPTRLARDALDIFIVYYLCYRALLVLRGTRAMQVGIGLAAVFVLLLHVVVGSVLQ